MKKFLLFVALCYTMMALANAQQRPNENEIWYTTTDEQVVNPYKSDVFGAKIISNVYKDGKGIITFDGKVTSIGSQAFWNYCPTLTSISIPYYVTNIGPYAFSGCPNLTDIVIPENVESIGNFALARSGFTSITIPASVTDIVATAFEACPNLTTMSVEQGNTVYDSRDNCNAIIKTETNTLISGCKNSVIPTSVTSIGAYAFRNCTFTSITIPNSVTSIGNSSFSGCRALTSIEIPNSVITIGVDAFSFCTALKSIEIPNSVTTINSSAFWSCTALKSIEIPSSVTTIGTNAFTECTALETVTFMSMTPPSNDDKYHDGEWFSNCSKLSSIYVPDAAVSTYQSEWSSYASMIKSILEIPRAEAIAEINKAIDGVTDEDVRAIAEKAITDINNATSEE